MNWLDVLIVLPVLVGLVRGLMRGFITEIIAFVVVILGVLKYGLIVLVVVFVMDRTNDTFHYLDDAEVVQTSFFYPKFVKITDAILSFSRSELG